jgi:DNA-binding cell septation regulator SpoVG
VTDKVLGCSSEILCYFDYRAFSLVVLNKLGRISRVNEILQLISLYELVSAHEIEINLILLILPEQKLPKNLNFRQILNPVVHEMTNKIQIHVFELYLGKLSADEIWLLFSLLYLILLEMEVAKFREGRSCSFVYSVVNVFAV